MRSGASGRARAGSITSKREQPIDPRCAPAGRALAAGCTETGTIDDVINSISDVKNAIYDGRNPRRFLRGGIIGGACRPPDQDLQYRRLESAPRAPARHQSQSDDGGGDSCQHGLGCWITKREIDHIPCRSCPPAWGIRTITPLPARGYVRIHNWYPPSDCAGRSRRGYDRPPDDIRIYLPDAGTTLCLGSSTPHLLGYVPPRW